MRNLLVVGSSSGIGKRVALEAVDQWMVWQVGRRINEELVAESSLHWDATSEAFPVEALPDRLDGLVYCPGSIRLKPFTRLSEEDFLEEYQINALGAVRVLKAAYPALKQSGNASVVLFSSVAAQTGMPMHASVAMAKAAVEGLVRSLAAEWAPSIRVNAVAPSLTDTPLASQLLKTTKMREAAAARHPMERYGEAADIAEAVHFLLSERSSWITGQVLAVDGGMGSLRRFG